MPAFFYFDLEMGGLEPAIHGLTEISAARLCIGSEYQSHEIEATFHSYVKPRAELVYDDDALDVQKGFFEGEWARLWDDGEFESDPPSAADCVFAWLELNGRAEAVVLSALKKWSARYFGAESYKVSPWSHNASCDVPFLMAAYDRCFPESIDPNRGTNEMMPCNRAGRCSMNLFRVMRDLGVHGCYRANLDTVLEFYEIPIAPEHRHTARGDVPASATAVFRMLQHMRSHFGASEAQRAA